MEPSLLSLLSFSLFLSIYFSLSLPLHPSSALSPECSRHENLARIPSVYPLEDKKLPVSFVPALERPAFFESFRPFSFAFLPFGSLCYETGGLFRSSTGAPSCAVQNNRETSSRNNQLVTRVGKREAGVEERTMKTGDGRPANGKESKAPSARFAVARVVGQMCTHKLKYFKNFLRLMFS